MANFHGRMPRARRDGRELLLLLCTGDEEAPITREVGWFDMELGRWEGDWRYYDGEGGYAKAEQIAWAPLPEVDQSFTDLITPKRKPKAKPPAIRETPDGISVVRHGPTKEPRPGSSYSVATDLGISYFAITDETLKTNDRFLVEASVCNNFRIAVRQRLDAQRN